MLEKTIQLYLPWPPTINNYYSHTSRGVYISKKGRLYSKLVEEAVREQTSGFTMLLEPLQMELVLYPPDRRKRDLDNHLKALQDSLTRSAFYEDDSLIDQLVVYRGEIVKKGLALVRFSTAEPLLKAPEGY